MNKSTNLIKNDIEYVINNMGQTLDYQHTDEAIKQFLTMEVVINPITEVTEKLIHEVMNEMIWPPMGKTQTSINKHAFTTYNAVIRFFRKEKESVNIMRTYLEAREAIKVILRRRNFVD